jgi:nucleoprotein TPR
VASLSQESADAQEKYERELLAHAQNIEKLNKLKEEVNSRSSHLADLEQERSRAQARVTELEEKYAAESQHRAGELAVLREQLQVAGQQNAALLSQLESVSGQLLDVSGRNAALDSSSQQLDTSFRSLNEDEANNAQLMSIIKYLRKEKEIMGGRLEVAEAEIVRTGQQLEQANKMAADAVQALDMERWVTYQHLPCQCCGSGFNKSGYGSGSSISSESGSDS